MERRFVEVGVDFERANAARMYDYLLGGAHNFAVDRVAAERLRSVLPEVEAVARANRAFLRRVVLWCLDQGVTQFLDLGSGVPTVGNVHEITAAVEPSARVAYIDFEPVAVAHAHDLLAGNSNATITRADLRDPASVLHAPGVADLLDLHRPVALLAVAVLHFIDDTALQHALHTYRSALAPGSVVAISHASDDRDDRDLAQRVRSGAAAYADSATPMVLRRRDELRALVAGLDIAEPGLVDIRDWPTPRPDEPATSGYGLVARLPFPSVGPPPSPAAGT